ncbi:MAG: hypothetical protein QME94_13855, partial [Anaerolineae bacterium]|nr:hypothetical protein [Anaerolineae bacterium]
HARPGACRAGVEASEATYEEYVVLDGAGRLQVPRDYLEQWGIGTRAKLELVEDGILIRPINAGRPAAEAAEARPEVSLYYAEDAPPEAAQPRWRRRLGDLASRFGRPRKR